jgi:o-succinylbenzoate synthase
MAKGAMDPLPLYREATIAGALELLRNALVPDLLAVGVDAPEQLSERWARWRGNPMAKATLELAVWDCWARQAGRPLREVLGGTATAVEVGASLGIASIDETVDAVGRHVAEGYRRIKLKIAPGSDRAVLSAVCLDESLTSAARTAAALDLGACSVVNMKLGRVGGLAEARRIHALCLARGVPMWCGGMLETGIGRAHNIHLATLPGFTMPGDTASASRTYTRDLVNEPLEATDGIMPVPDGPGIGVTLDRAFFEDITLATEVVA